MRIFANSQAQEAPMEQLLLVSLALPVSIISAAMFDSI
jgi:hypothetical protein